MVNKIIKKCEKIKILLTDVDGVLTDGGMYYSAQGDVMKKFHARDGMGVNMLRRNNIPTVIITKEKSQIVKRWAKKMNVIKVYDNVLKKELILEKISKKFLVSKSEMAYIGDDVNDLEIIKMVGFSATPKDGIEKMKKNVDHICHQKGGNGVLREISDLILLSKFNTKVKLY